MLYQADIISVLIHKKIPDKYTLYINQYSQAFPSSQDLYNRLDPSTPNLTWKDHTLQVFRFKNCIDFDTITN